MIRPGRPTVTADIDAAADCVRSGGLIAYPTEAVYGLGCDPGRPDSLQRLFELKGRAAQKGLILIASDIAQLEPWVLPFDYVMQARLAATWPGPVTWVVPARPDVSPLLTGQSAGASITLAVRVSAHPVVIGLCRALGQALVSTSANRSGEAPARTAQQVAQALGDGVDLVVNGECGDRERPSDIFDVRTGQQLR